MKKFKNVAAKWNQRWWTFFKQILLAQDTQNNWNLTRNNRCSFEFSKCFYEQKRFNDSFFQNSNNKHVYYFKTRFFRLKNYSDGVRLVCLFFFFFFFFFFFDDPERTCNALYRKKENKKKEKVKISRIDLIFIPTIDCWICIMLCWIRQQLLLHYCTFFFSA